MDPCILAILGVLLPPVAVLLQKGCGFDFGINLVLTLLLFWVGGILHAFFVFGVPLCPNILCIFLPPVAVFIEYGCLCEFWVSLVLTILGWLPGVIYSYYVLMLKAPFSGPIV